MTSASHRRRFLLLPAVLALVGSALAVPAAAYEPAPGVDGAVFFSADGLRQDMVAKYAAQGRLPTMASFLKGGTKAADDGLLTEAPPNTGAGWYSLATGAWPAVHGSTNNTFHINGAPFGNRTAAFDPNVLQAESIAQSAERGGLKVAQVEWAGGRNATINGPTIDYMTFHSGRGVATNYTSPADNAAFVASFGLQFDHPAGFAGQAPFAAAAPTDATGWSNVPTSFSPAKEMRLRVLDFGVDKYGLNAYLFDSTNDSSVNYDQVLFAPAKDGSAAVGTLAEGKWADVKVKIAGGTLDGKTAGMLVKVERLAPDLSQVRLFHTSVSRAIASWTALAGRSRLPDGHRLRRVPRPAVPDVHRGRLRDPRGRHHQRGDLRRAGTVLVHRTPADARVRGEDLQAGPPARRLPDHGRVPAPVPGPGQPDPARRRGQPGLRRRQPRRREGRPRGGA